MDVFFPHIREIIVDVENNRLFRFHELSFFEGDLVRWFQSPTVGVKNINSLVVGVRVLDFNGREYSYSRIRDTGSRWDFRQEYDTPGCYYRKRFFVFVVVLSSADITLVREVAPHEDIILECLDFPEERFVLLEAAASDQISPVSIGTVIIDRFEVFVITHEQFGDIEDHRRAVRIVGFNLVNPDNSPDVGFLDGIGYVFIFRACDRVIENLP